MTLRKYYVGGMGPYLYDDAIPLLDQDGDFAGQDQHGFITDGPVKVTLAPTEDDDVCRKLELDELEFQAESTAYFFARIL